MPEGVAGRFSGRRVLERSHRVTDLLVSRTGSTLEEMMT
jgi:hypothetical protein